MKKIGIKRKERTTEELIKSFKEMAGDFDKLWTGFSLKEREKFKKYLASMRDQK
jgi:hypothetical protein